jgi:hypothetical protein
VLILPRTVNTLYKTQINTKGLDGRKTAGRWPIGIRIVNLVLDLGHVTVARGLFSLYLSISFSLSLSLSVSLSLSLSLSIYISPWTLQNDECIGLLWEVPNCVLSIRTLSYTCSHSRPIESHPYLYRPSVMGSWRKRLTLSFTLDPCFYFGVSRLHWLITEYGADNEMLLVNSSSVVSGNSQRYCFFCCHHHGTTYGYKWEMLLHIRFPLPLASHKFSLTCARDNETCIRRCRNGKVVSMQSPIQLQQMFYWILK